MRCRYVNKIYMNEGNGFTVALYSTQDTSVPLSARDKYLASRKDDRVYCCWIQSAAYRSD